MLVGLLLAGVLPFCYQSRSNVFFEGLRLAAKGLPEEDGAVPPLEGAWELAQGSPTEVEREDVREAPEEARALPEEVVVEEAEAPEEETETTETAEATPEPRQNVNLAPAALQTPAVVSGKDYAAPPGALNVSLALENTDFGRMLELRRREAQAPGRVIQRTLVQAQVKLSMWLQPLLQEIPLEVPRGGGASGPAGGLGMLGGGKKRRVGLTVRIGYVMVATMAAVVDRDVGFALAVLLAQPVTQLLGLPEWAGVLLCMALALVPL